MQSSSLLLQLLDAVISQDEQRIYLSMKEVSELLLPFIVLPDLSTTHLTEIVRSLLRIYPNQASTASLQDGSLPLHFAASLGSVGVASALISVYPHAAATANKKGKIPLHYASREGRTDMVQFLLQVDPATARIISKKQKLALHFAAGEGHRNVVQALLRVHPEGAYTTSSKGKLPIHLAARWGHMHVAQELLCFHPNAAASADWEGSLPLHDAAREGQTSMSQFLMARYPRGLSTANLRGEIPLFPAVRSGNVTLVIAFLQAWPKGGRHILQHVTVDDNINEWDERIVELCLRGAVENFNQCTIFHQQDRALYYTDDDDDDAMEMLTPLTNRDPVPRTTLRPIFEHVPPLQDDCPNAIRLGSVSEGGSRPKSPIIEERESKKRSTFQNDSSAKRRKSDLISGHCQCSCGNGGTLQCEFYHLHSALSSGASAPVIQIVLDRFGDQELQEIDCQGRLPLHIAMTNTTTEDAISIVLQDVLRSYPDAATVRDNKGRLPLHVGLESNANFRLIQAILEVHPVSKVQCCQTRDSRFVDQAPLWMATAFDCDLSTIYHLLREDPSILNDIQQSNHDDANGHAV